MFDIHSHILPEVDDGAGSIQESFDLLTDMYSQGITDVIATPHFYPTVDNFEDFTEKRKCAYQRLKEFETNQKIPNIYIGCEILYYKGISKISDFSSFTFNNSNYLLLELAPSQINKTVFQEIEYIIKERNIIPIIAHIERYHLSFNYNKLLRFVKENKILTQVNASSVSSKKYCRTIHKLFSKDIINFIATDTHSVNQRPPLLKQAFEIIEKEYGIIAKQKLLKNADKLLNKISKKDTDNEIK